MNQIVINYQGISASEWEETIISYCLKVLDEIKRDNWELSVVLCDDFFIQNLNKEYRGKDEPTDVLSFTLGETVQDDEKDVYLPGDIVISIDTLFKNAEYFQISVDEELRRLLIHGILHLDGMDHVSIEKNEPMLVLQEEILNRLKTKNGGKW